MRKINSIPVRKIKIGTSYGWREKIKINDKFYKIHHLVMNNPLLLWEHIQNTENKDRVQKDVFNKLLLEIKTNYPVEYNSIMDVWNKKTLVRLKRKLKRIDNIQFIGK